jgi:hypothetical protein
MCFRTYFNNIELFRNKILLCESYLLEKFKEKVTEKHCYGIENAKRKKLEI